MKSKLARVKSRQRRERFRYVICILIIYSLFALLEILSEGRI